MPTTHPRPKLALLKRRLCLPLRLVVALAVGGMAGCGGPDAPQLIDHMEELEFNSQLVSLNEVFLGNYRISTATSNHTAEKPDESRTWVQVKFQLFVVVSPENVSTVERLYKRHKGIFDDKIVQIFRSATMEELSDPRWAALKSRVTDYARSLLGTNRVRQIVINDSNWEPI